MHVLALVSRKGGTTKTTTTANLGWCLAERGKRVLLIDADPQGNLGHSFGVDPEAVPGLYEALSGTVPAIEPAWLVQVAERLELLPTSSGLADVDLRKDEAPPLIRQALRLLPARWDYVLIDTPPSLGGMAISALVAASCYVATLTPDAFAARALVRVLEEADAIAAKSNPSLRRLGILLARVDSRTVAGQAAERDVRGAFGKDVFRTVVRQNISALEAAAFGRPVCAHAPSSSASEDYHALAAEVVSRLSRAAVS